ncbi:hypothetical protein WN944_026605 [Citrus x changshan-huyou]|uniref:Uncharacterized protein n=1 Tax=Citrus x changshan-huyou TaxID=2935761 RepID=A0AAP0QCH3_9ROSI
MAKLSWSSIALVLFLSVVFAVEVANAGGEGSLKPERTYGHKEECPCYNNWKTKEGTPKCP